MIYSTVEIDTTNTVNQVGSQSKSPATYKTEVTNRESVTRRPTLGDPIPVFTPLDMFEKFNTGWKDTAPIEMMTDVNGGFRITVLEDKLNTLRISKQLIYDMGLNSFLVQEGVVNTDPEPVKPAPKEMDCSDEIPKPADPDCAQKSTGLSPRSLDLPTDESSFLAQCTLRLDRCASRLNHSIPF